MGTLITGAENIRQVQRLSQLYAMKLHLKGMKHSSRRSIILAVKKQYGFKGTNESVVKQFEMMIREPEIIDAIRVTWEYIANDILEEGKLMDGRDVREITLDADRVESLGNLSVNAVEFWRTLSHDEKCVLAFKALPDKEYGL